MALVRFADVGTKGLVYDQMPNELADGAWSDARNVRFANGYAQKSPGYVSALGTPTVAPYGIAYAPSSSTRYWAYFGLTKAYTTDGTTHTNITRQSGGTDSDYTGTADDKWVCTNLSGILIATNGVDAPQSWVPGSSNDCANLANWTSNHKCKSIRAFKQHLVALNVTENTTAYPYLVRWSHPADPGAVPSSWDVTDATKDAGQVDLADTVGEVLDGGALNDVFLVWKQNATYAMRYVGPPSIFAFAKVTEQSGILARNCWCETPMGLVVLALGDVVLQVGAQAPRSIIDQRNRKWLFDNLSQTYYARSFVVHSEDKAEVLVCFPSLASTGWCDKALVWNYSNDTWAIRDLGNVSAGAVGYIASASTYIDSVSSYIDDVSTMIDAGESNLIVPAIALASAANTKIYALDAAETLDGTAMTSRLERTGLALGEPASVKLVRAVRPRIDGVTAATLNVYVGGSMDVDTAPTWAGPYSFTVGSSLKVDCLVSGRYFGVRFESTSGEQWRLRSFDLDAEPIGDY